MREALRQINSTTLAIVVAVADATVWLAALPFELYARRIATMPHTSTLTLVAILCVNLLLLALIASAAVAMAELIRRGVTRRVPVLLRSLAVSRSRRSGR